MLFNGKVTAAPGRSGLRRFISVFRGLSGSAVLLVALAPAESAGGAPAELKQVQSIELKKGWNSVFLRVFPEGLNPQEVFNGTPVSIAAAYFRSHSPARYISDPDTDTLRKEGWSIWYAPSRPDAALTDLAAVFGNRAYLIFAERDFTWNVSGVVHFGQLRWKPDSFNLVGFPVSAQFPPTFEKFFSGSKAHAALQAYQLVDGKWTRVINPAATTIRGGTAYWVYSRGASDYQGPLEVEIPKGEGISVGNRDPSAVVVLTNSSSDPLDLSVERHAGGGSGLPLALGLRGFDPVTKAQKSVAVEMPNELSFETLEPGQKSAFVLEARVEEMQSAMEAALLKISTSNGVEHWVPVVGTRHDKLSAD